MTEKKIEPIPTPAVNDTSSNTSNVSDGLALGANDGDLVGTLVSPSTVGLKVGDPLGLRVGA